MNWQVRIQWIKENNVGVDSQSFPLLILFTQILLRQNYLLKITLLRIFKFDTDLRTKFAK